MASLDAYAIGKVIGKGSYGEVFLAKHREDRQQYVLKKVDLQKATTKERKAAELEARLLSQLRHPSIVSYKESFQDEVGFLYISMAYCEGGDLHKRLKDQKGQFLEEIQVVEWFVQIAMALQYMHERLILHRDLKTQNIFLTKSNIIKVGDLGIARVLDSGSDMASTMIDTPYYMSPEMFSNKPYNHKSDVWALGCCLFEMCTLKHAFNAKDMSSLVYKILKGKIIPPLPRQYSKDLCEIISFMLNQDPDKRPSAARILRHRYIKKHIALLLEGTKNRQKQKSKVAGVPSNDGPKPSGRTGGSKADSGYVGTDPEAPVATVSAVECIIDEGHEAAKPKKPSLARGGSADRASVERSGPSKGRRDEKKAAVEKPTDDGKESEPKRNAASDYQSQKEREKEIIRRQMADKKRSFGERAASKNALKVEKAKEPGLEKERGAAPAPGEKKRSPVLEEKRASQRVRSADKAKANAAESKTPRQRRPLPRPPQESLSAGDVAVGSRSPGARRRYKVASSVHAKSYEEDEDEEEGGEKKQRGRADSDKSSKSASDSTPQSSDLPARERRRLRQKQEHPHPAVSVPLNSALPSPKEVIASRAKRLQENSGATPKSRGEAAAEPRRDLAADSGDCTDGPARAWRGESCEADSDSTSSELEEISLDEPDPAKQSQNRRQSDVSSLISALDTTLRMPAPPAGRESPEAIPEEVPESEEMPPFPFHELSPTTSGRLRDRITRLREESVRGIGEDKLVQALHIIDTHDEDFVEDALVKLMGRENFDKYGGPIWQLKFCESFRMV